MQAKLYMAKRNFSVTVNNQTLTFRAGQFIHEPHIITKLLEGHCQEIAELGHNYKMVECERCGHNNVMIEPTAKDESAKVIALAPVKKKIIAG